jgi:hypothetical protein
MEHSPRGCQGFTEWRSLQAKAEKDVSIDQKDCGQKEKETGHGVRARTKE